MMSPRYLIPVIYLFPFINSFVKSTTFHYEEGISDGYGPSEWYLVNDNCGHYQQSPIEIDPSDFSFDTTCNTPLNWNIDQTSYTWSVTHKGEDGHTIVLKSDAAKSDIYLENAFQYEGNDQHSKYKFDSLHFHWGPGDKNGSEHVYTGITSTLEVHFVHYSSDYSDVGAAVGAWDALAEDDTQDMHTLGVVGFLFEEVDDDSYNAAADAIILQLAVDSAMQDVWSDAEGTAYLDIVIADLVDASDFEEHYYHYEGSLTTPPCTPAVRWHLAQNTIKVQSSTMDKFRASTVLWRHIAVDADTNFRPIQSNPSCIWTCAGNDDLKYCPQIISEDIVYPEWHYEEDLPDGPSNWKSIKGGYLCAHSQQSPISINPSELKALDSCKVPLNWDVDDTVYNWTVTHKGEGGHTLSVYSADAKNDVYLQNSYMITDQHWKYKLYGFHFHWGPGNKNGSEHIYEGITTTLEVHFVHYSTDYGSVGEAVAAWDDLSEDEEADMHTLGVVGFLFEEVRDADQYNGEADAVLLEFAQNEDMTEVWATANGSAFLSFSITDLVDPEDFESNYYHYWGSLTTPPCTPAVNWHLAQNTIKVRKSTMDAFREKTALWTYSGGIVEATTNFRPVQSNPSCISKCAGSSDLEYCPDGVSNLEDEVNTGRLMPLWITIAVMVMILLVVCSINVDFKRKGQRVLRLIRNTGLHAVHPSPRSSNAKMTEVPTTEANVVESMTVSELPESPERDESEMMIVYESRSALDEMA